MVQTQEALPARLVQAFANLGGDLAPHTGTDAALEVITARAVQAIPNADFAAVSKGHPGTWKTVAPTDDLAVHVDEIQYQLDSGPCLDAMIQDDVFHSTDISSDPRWPEFGPRAATETGVYSMLSVRIVLEHIDLSAALNMYSKQRDAFDGTDQLVSTLLATHSALALTSAHRQHQNQQLQVALASNRDIGTAIGILMHANKVTKEQAFDLLRISSQQRNRRLVEIARDVVETGQLDLPA